MRMSSSLGRLMMTTAVALAAIAASAPVSAATIFSENFEGVTGADEINVSMVPAAEMKANTRTFNSDATQASFNVRLATNAINAAASINTFDAFFTSKFLVIGDNTGILGGTPNGANGTTGTTMVLTFAVPAVSAGSYQVSFTYDFDANQNANTDDFFVDLVFTDTSTVRLLTITDPINASTRSASFNTSVGSDGKTASGLRFTLFEEDIAGSGSSAVGVDNITINAVPEPGVLALLGAAFLAFSLTKRRRKQ